jgi:hypothetical protein
MVESQRRVKQAAASAEPRVQAVARHVLGDSGTQRRWHIEHSHYMRTVADRMRREQQRAALRTVAFGLVHRMALFQYLRDSTVRSEERRRVVALFHGSRAYSEAVVTEHRLFIRSAASQLCATYIGDTLLEDPAFDGPFAEYERRYHEYFELFCHVRACAAAGEHLFNSLLPYFKLRVSEQRAAILALDGSRPDTRVSSRPVASDRRRPDAAARAAAATTAAARLAPTAVPA